MQLNISKFNIKNFFPVPVLCLSGFILACYYSMQIPPIVDDYDIIVPVLKHIAGTSYDIIKYQRFPFIFYEFFFRILSILNIQANAIVAGRCINSILFAINILLFYKVARYYMERSWACLACVLFIFAPAVFYSGLVIKTESLLLTELFICIISSNKIMEHPEKTGWHIIAALSCGLSLTTKYNILLLTIYITSILFPDISGKEKSLKLKIVLFLKNRNTWIFAAVFLCTVFVLWPEILDLKQIIEKNAIDSYFLPYPTVFRAVDETFAFPYGRFSYSLVVIFPLAMGIVNYALALAAIPLRVIPRRLLIMGGVYILSFCIVFQSITLLRIPYMFTPVIPFFFLFTTLLLRACFVSSRNKIIKISGGILISIALIFSMLQFDSMFLITKNMFDASFKGLKTSGSKALLIHSEWVKKQNINPVQIEESIKKINPENILVLDSFFYNYRKYSNPLYNKQYKFFDKLMAGETEYQILWKIETKIPLNCLYFDPEISLQYTMFKRKE